MHSPAQIFATFATFTISVSHCFAMFSKSCFASFANEVSQILLFSVFRLFHVLQVLQMRFRKYICSQFFVCFARVARFHKYEFHKVSQFHKFSKVFAMGSLLMQSSVNQCELVSTSI